MDPSQPDICDQTGFQFTSSMNMCKVQISVHPCHSHWVILLLPSFCLGNLLLIQASFVQFIHLTHWLFSLRLLRIHLAASICERAKILTPMIHKGHQISAVSRVRKLWLSASVQIVVDCHMVSSWGNLFYRLFFIGPADEINYRWAIIIVMGYNKFSLNLRQLGMRCKHSVIWSPW